MTLRLIRQLFASCTVMCGTFLTSVHAQSALTPSGQPALKEFRLSETPQLGIPQSGVLTIESDRLFSQSAFGRRIASEIEAEGAVLTAENRRIEAELRAEEQDLTARRPEMDPQSFRILADAFDEKVQDTRRVQERKLNEINAIGESARREFLNVSLPVLQDIMQQAGAGAIIEKSTVFLSADAADVTDLAIARIDAVLGDGTQTSELPD